MTAYNMAGSWPSVQMFPAAPPGTKTVAVLPPVGKPGQTIILQTGGQQFYYVWNAVTNQWVNITNNNYVQYPGGPDITTDVLGTITFNRFDDPNQWIVNQASPFFTVNVAGGPAAISTAASGVGSACRIFSGVLARRRIAPNLAGSIEIEFFFDSVIAAGAGIVDANHFWDLCAFIACDKGGTGSWEEAIKVTMRKDNANQRGFYACTAWGVDAANQDSIGANTANMGTAVVNFSMRFLLKWYNVVATIGFYVDRQNIIYHHNGAAGVALAGVATASTFQNAICGCNPGFSWGFGMHNGNLDYAAANVIGRLTQVNVYQGRLLGY